MNADLLTLTTEEHRFANCGKALPTDAAGLTELLSEISEPITRSPDDGGAFFRKQTRATQRALATKIKLAIRTGLPLAPALSYVTCEWYALCDQKATTMQPHPILGGVPTCARCSAALAAMSA
jgi:hypothetical protein